MPLFRTRIAPLIQQLSSSKDKSPSSGHQNNNVNGVVPSSTDCQFTPSSDTHQPSTASMNWNNKKNSHHHRHSSYNNCHENFNDRHKHHHHQHSQSLESQNLRQKQQQLAFYCQLAHGSQTALISGFGNVRELYRKIAESFDILPEDILFCTLNTHRIEMTELLGGQIGLDDFIYAHRKGRPKEIELIKIEDSLGLTLTDNGAGYVFIKRIKENSVMDRLKVVQVGDHIEKINGISLVGKRHFEVANMLKDIEKGSTFTLRLVEPLSRNGFGIIGPRCSMGSAKRGKTNAYGSGKETLRFRADGHARIEKMVESSREKLAIIKINNLLDTYMGICDNVLARRLWEIAQNKLNSMDLAKAIESTMPETFNFSDDFIFEVWKTAFEARNNA